MSRSMRRLANTLLLPVTLLAVAAGTAPAAAQNKPIAILFVGNSFFHGAYQPVRSFNAAAVTDENAAAPAGSPLSEGTAGPYGGIPGIFKRLTDQLGMHYEVHNELVSGKSLQFHYENALSIINQPRWDVVVMHDYSTGPVPAARSGNPERFTRYANLLEQTVHAANNSAAIYLYETWARADLTYPANSPYHGESIGTMGRDLHAGYCREFRENGHFRGVAAAGDAWQDAISSGVALADPSHPEAGKINLWGADSYHPSIYGAYLNALVLVREITGADVTRLGEKNKAAAELGIAPGMALKLQKLAARQTHAC